MKALFYVTRQNGSFVPLIAMDELPGHIQIEDVPRFLHPRDLFGMINIGNFDVRREEHRVTAGTEVLPLIIRPSGTPMTADATRRSRLLPTPNPSEAISTTPESSGVDVDQPRTNQIHSGSTVFTSGDRISDILQRSSNKCSGASPHTVLENSTVPAAPLPSYVDRSCLPHNDTERPGGKVYCSYWLRKGECDYAQQGCLFKHEMPLDKETLLSLGLQDIPRWYRMKHGLGSYAAVHGAGAAFNGLQNSRYGLSEQPSRPIDDSWRKDSSISALRSEVDGGHKEESLYNRSQMPSSDFENPTLCPWVKPSRNYVSPPADQKIPRASVGKARGACHASLAPPKTNLIPNIQSGSISSASPLQCIQPSTVQGTAPKSRSGRTRHRRRHRSARVSSPSLVLSDVETEMMRTDKARRAKEEQHCDQMTHKAEQARKDQPEKAGDCCDLRHNQPRVPPLVLLDDDTPSLIADTASTASVTTNPASVGRKRETPSTAAYKQAQHELERQKNQENEPDHGAKSGTGTEDRVPA